MSNKYKILLLILITISIPFIISSPNNIMNNNDMTLGLYNKMFKDYVIFYPQHQDDEVLWGGSAIVEAINQRGADHVYIVLVSDGSGVNIFKSKQYENLSRKEKAAIRNDEFKAALKILGVKEDNIIILADLESDEVPHFKLMKKIALEFEANFKSVTHVAHSYKYDNHPMHIKNGKVIQKLYKKGEIKDVMYFLKPNYLRKVPPLKRVIYTAGDKEKYDKIRNACLQYKSINKENNRHGIGYMSAHSYFDNLLKDKSLTSILHLPLK